MSLKIKVSVAATLLVLSGSAVAEDSTTGPFGFTPIDSSANSADWNPSAPWKLPEGFTQRVVSNETVLNIYDEGRDDWNDMNTVNETGIQRGRYLYRTHEVRGEAEGGAVSVVDMKTGEAKILAQDLSWNAVDGIRWTPWGTIVIAEEVTGGRVFEIILEKNDPTTAAHIIDRPAAGRMAHEGIAFDSKGNMYVVDEFRGVSAGHGGGIYKFVPDTYGDLSSGQLFALAVSGGEYNTGEGMWVGPIDAADARMSGTAYGGASYQRPEDLEVIGNTLYAAITEGPRDENNKEFFEGRVLAIDLDSMRVNNFVMPGQNVPVEIGKPGQEGHQSGWDSVDNLAKTPDGKLMIIEDNKPSDIWVAGKDHNKDGMADNVWLFGSLTDPGAEGTGIYVGAEPNTLYVNVQHSAADDGDATWAITKE